MKKLLLLSAVSAVVLGLAQTSQAGVHVSVGFGFPLPSVVVTRRAPVVVETLAAPCAPAPVVVQAPPCVVVSEPVCYPVYRHGFYQHDGWGHFHGYRR